MTEETPTSASFRRAAAAEIKRLWKQRDKLGDQAAKQEAALAETRARMHGVERQIEHLTAAAGPEVVREDLGIKEAPEAPEQASEPDGGRTLKGAAIRETAVRVAVAFRRVGQPLHYRKWLELVEQAGYSVAGQRPDAVFLNQLVRSPVVKATTENGYYEIDPGAVDRLRTQLRQQQAELAEMASSFDVSEYVTFGTGRQDSLNRDIRRTQRELEEAIRSLEAADVDGGRQAA